MKKIISTRPNPPRLVNDDTKTLTPQQIIALEQKLVSYSDSTSNQIVIVIVSTTDNYSIEEAAIELGRKWGVGTKDFNNGVVILVAKDDRKITIQAGYGLEGALTDLLTKSIIDNEITPNFKQGNYYRGLDQGIDAIIKAAEGRYKAPANYARKKKGASGLSILGIIIFLIIMSVIGGGRRGGGGLVSGSGWLLASMLGGSGRSWSGGGSSGGGGGGGGGFGGFGGGSFGGGGASGSW